MQGAGKIVCRVRKWLKGTAPFYLFGIFVILGMKLFYARAGSDELKWILTPTVRWVELLSGIPFVYVPGAGYANHSLRYLIAPSCAGVNFMIIMTAMLFFPFLHRMKEPERRTGTSGISLSDFWLRVCWMGGSLLFSYLITIPVNGLRILAAVYLPDYFRRAGLLGSFLSEEKLHMIIGVAVYLVCLLTVYRLADRLACRLEGETEETPEGGSSRKSAFGAFKELLIPAFWYFCIALGLPFAGRAYRGEIKGYGEYALPVMLAGGAVLAVWGLGKLVRGKMRRNRRVN